MLNLQLTMSEGSVKLEISVYVNFHPAMNADLETEMYNPCFITYMEVYICIYLSPTMEVFSQLHLPAAKRLSIYVE